MGLASQVATISLILLFALDVFTDVATGVELILNDKPFCLQMLPLRRLLWTKRHRLDLPHCLPSLYSDYACAWFLSPCLQKRGHVSSKPREGVLIENTQGFVAAAGQVVLSLIVLSRGVLIHSLAQTIHFLTTPDLEQRESFLAAERTPKWYWGLIQVVSLLFSIVSLLQTVVYFNECEKRRLSAWRLFVAVPFYAVTICYRVAAIALLSLFFRTYVLIPVLLIVVFNTVSFKLLGLDLPRSLVYGVCSLTAPVGFNRCKAPKLQPLGYVSDEVTYTERSPEQVDILRERSKRFLALHLIFGIFVLGISLVLVYVMLNFSQLYTPLTDTTILPRQFINGYILPAIGLLALASAVGTVTYCCTVLCCFEDEYIYPLTIH